VASGGIHYESMTGSRPLQNVVYRGYPLFLQENSGIVNLNIPRPIPSTSFEVTNLNHLKEDNQLSNVRVRKTYPKRMPD
jgi:hypothetical protein